MDGPGEGSPPPAYVSTEEAARWLGLSVQSFRRLVGLDPPKKRGVQPLPGVQDWVRPVRVGGSLLWHWLAVVYLQHVLQTMPPGEPGEDD